MIELSQIEENKRKMRRRLAALPFAEKLRIVEKLRDRSRSISSNPLRRKQGRASTAVSPKKSG
jgi:hypothetical protein